FGLAAVAAACSTSDPDESVEISSITGSALAFNGDAVALLSPERAALYGDLATASATPPELVVERASTAVTGIALDLPPLAGSPRDSALELVARFQKLFDDRIAASEYRLAAGPTGCDDAVVMLDRFVAGTQVVGSRLTLHFDDRGHLVYITNGVAPVKGKIVGANLAMFPNRVPLEKVTGAKQGVTLPRVPVLAPMPDGSGLHKADLVAFVDGRGKRSVVLAIGDTAIAEPLDAAADDHPAPSVRPTAYVAPGDSVPSYVSYGAAGGLAIPGFAVERNPIERAFRYLEGHATTFHTGEARCQFRPRTVRESPDGDVHVRLDQRHATLPVFGGELVLTLDGDHLVSVLGRTIDNLDARTVPSLSEAAAIANADATLAAGASAEPGTATEVAQAFAKPARVKLGILPRWAVRMGGGINAPIERLVYEVRRGNYTLYVDALDGIIRNSVGGRHHARVIVNDANGLDETQRELYVRESVDAVHVPGAPLNLDTAPGRVGGSASASLVRVRDTLSALQWNVANLDYVANTNVNISNGGCGNAFYDPDTDQAYFCLGFAADDVIAHELTHGVIEGSSRLTYQDESGAINEAFADVMGNLIFREPANTWFVGELASAGPFRNMSAFAHMAGYQHRDATCNSSPSSCDAGFVHTNSGIINKAHQVLGDRIGRDKLLKLAFTTLTTRLPANARLNDVPLAERDVCERFVARGTTDLTGATFTMTDCIEIGRAFAVVGLAPGLVTDWSEPTLGFAGTHTFFPSPFDLTPGRCPVQNVEANLVQLSGAQTVDLDPATAVPTAITWGGFLSRLALRVPPGPLPFPLGTPFKTHTVDWFAIYGIEPALYTNVIPSPICPPLVEQAERSGTFDESAVFGNGNIFPAFAELGPTSTSIDRSCSLARVELELLDDAGNATGTQGVTATDDLVHWFLFVPVHFGETATITRAPRLTPGGARDLSGTIRFSYAVGRHFHVRFRYYFTTSTPGVLCTP
ncbi:MAG: M4 family metallopeptidase, partial [Kofleriaceae bacterium]